jgi:peptide/nickel transport system substrate-binding protein
MTRRPALRAAIALFLSCLVGCSGEPADHEASPTPGAVVPTEPQHGGSLVIAVQDDAKSLDPHAVTDAASMRMIENLYDTLLRYGDGYGEFAPGLAESVAVSDDGVTVTITLAEGAAFHSGRPVEPADIAYSIARIREMGVRAQQFEAVEAIQTPDARTVVLQLSQPVAAIRSYLAYPMNAVVDREVVEAHGGRLDRADAGSGPFRLVDWRQNQRLVMERFDGYHVEDLPYLDRVVYRPMPDETSRTTALRTGEVDLVNDVAAKDVAILEGQPGVVVESIPGTFWEYLGVNVRRPPLDDVRVRQAIAWAIDRDLLNRLVKLGRATPLKGGHIPANHWAHADLSIYPERNVTKAKALLAEAGHPDGIGVTLKVGAAFPYQVRAAGVVKQMLADAGIRVELRSLESAVFFDSLGSGDFDLALVGWVGFVDPDEWTYELFHSAGKYNQQGYANPELDELLERARRTLDRAERQRLYRQAQAIIARDAPMIFLYVNDHTSAWRQRVQGFRVHPTATTRGLRETWVTDAAEATR